MDAKTCCNFCATDECRWRCGFTYDICKPHGMCKMCKDFTPKGEAINEEVMNNGE